MSKDYYKILGVDKNASQDEIKKAFRKLAHEHHPDKKTGNAEKFKEANEAYSVLSDQQKRAQYDQFGSAGFNGGFGGGQGQGGFSGFEGFDFSGFGGFGGQSNGQGFEFDLGDIFGSMFGGGGRSRGRNTKSRGTDIQVDIEIPFKDSIFGTEKEVSLTKDEICAHCKGSRAEPGTTLDTCSNCKGSGQVIKQQRTILGIVENNYVCDICEGTGKIPKTKCKTCKGKGVSPTKSSFKVVIPAGIEEGETLRVRGKGEASLKGESGDLFIRVHVKPDPNFKKQGHDIYANLPISISDAVLGGEANFQSLDEKLTIKIPEAINHGEILRIKNKGVPYSTHHRGDLMLKIFITIPKKLSKEQRKLFEQLRNQ